MSLVLVAASPVSLCQAPDEATHGLRLADKINKLMCCTAEVSLKAVTGKSPTFDPGCIQAASDLRRNVSAAGNSLGGPCKASKGGS